MTLQQKVSHSHILCELVDVCSWIVSEILIVFIDRFVKQDIYPSTVFMTKLYNLHTFDNMLNKSKQRRKFNLRLIHCEIDNVV